MATPPEYRQADEEREGLTLRDYLGVMWRRKWIIILVTVVATGAAFGFSYRQAKVYQAQADLIYEQQLDVANPLTGQTYTDPNARSLELNSVDAIIKSEPIVTRAAALLRDEGMPTTGFTVSSELAEAGTTTGQTSNVVSIFATSEDPELAAAAVAGLRRRLRRVAQGPRAHADRRCHQGGREGDEELPRLQGVLRLPHPAAAAPRPADPQLHRHRQLPRARGCRGADGADLAEAAAQRDPRLRRRPLRRHRARLPARAVRHAPPAAGRRRGAAPPAGARARAAPLARADEVSLIW